MWYLRFSRKNGVRSVSSRQRKRCAAAPQDRRGHCASRPARPRFCLAPAARVGWVAAPHAPGAHGVPAADGRGCAIWCEACQQLQPLQAPFELQAWRTHSTTKKHTAAASLRSKRYRVSPRLRSPLQRKARPNGWLGARCSGARAVRGLWRSTARGRLSEIFAACGAQKVWVVLDVKSGEKVWFCFHPCAHVTAGTSVTWE